MTAESWGVAPALKGQPWTSWRLAWKWHFTIVLFVKNSFHNSMFLFAEWPLSAKSNMAPAEMLLVKSSLANRVWPTLSSWPQLLLCARHFDDRYRGRALSAVYCGDPGERNRKFENFWGLNMFMTQASRADSARPFKRNATNASDDTQMTHIPTVTLSTQLPGEALKRSCYISVMTPARWGSEGGEES